MKAVNSLLSCEWLQTTRLRASTIARVEVVKSRVAGRSKVHRSPGLLSGSSPSRFRVGARDVVYPPSILRGTTHAEANLGHIVHTRLFNVSSLGVLERARSRRSAAREAARVGKLLAVSCENRSQARPRRVQCGWSRVHHCGRLKHGVSELKPPATPSGSEMMDN